MKRTDCHSVGNIVPSDYEHVGSFAWATKKEHVPIPAFGIDLVRQLQAEGKLVEIHPIMQCDVCGTHYIYGDLWLHKPSQMYLTMGWICSEKYGLIADRKEFEGAWAKFAQAYINAERRHALRDKIKQFLYDHPDIRPGLDLSGMIAKSMRRQLLSYGYLTEPQQVLLRRLIIQEAERAEKQEGLIDAQAGRYTVTGEVLGTRVDETRYGTTHRMLVEVTKPDGTYKLWGTIPAGVWDDLNGGVLKGKTVRFDATVTPKETGFGFFSRPTHGRIVQ